MSSEQKSSKESIIARIVETTGDLPTMPHVANLVMEKLSDANTTAKDLHEIITKDQALAARVLKIANSPFYGGARKATRLTDAINLMGFDSIRSIVMASALNDFFKTFGLAEKLLWEHSIGCASIAKRIARLVRFPKLEEAFLAGLLHDIGKIVLNLKLPDQMLSIVQEVYNEAGITFSEVEQSTFGFTHAQIGQLIARKWNFASEIEEVIGFHHHPEQAKIIPVLSNIVNLANACCHKLEIGPTRNTDLNLMELTSAKVLKLHKDALDQLLLEVSDTISSEGGMLSM